MTKFNTVSSAMFSEAFLSELNEKLYDACVYLKDDGQKVSRTITKGEIHKVLYPNREGDDLHRSAVLAGLDALRQDSNSNVGQHVSASGTAAKGRKAGYFAKGPGIVPESGSGMTLTSEQIGIVIEVLESERDRPRKDKTAVSVGIDFLMQKLTRDNPNMGASEFASLKEALRDAFDKGRFGQGWERSRDNVTYKTPAATSVSGAASSARVVDEQLSA